MSGIRCPMCDYDADECECEDRFGPKGRTKKSGQEAVAWMTPEGLVIRGDIAAIVGWNGAYVGTGLAIPDAWVPFLYADTMRHNVRAETPTPAQKEQR